MTRATLVSGGGNDFLALVEPARDPTADEIVAWCARGVSVGADGVFALRRGQPGHVALAYWNADGHRAELCLNATRCAARLALERGLVAGEFTIQTDAGAFTARAAGARAAAVVLPAPSAPRPLTLEHEETSYPGWFLEVGVPHFVLLSEAGLAAAPVERLGRSLRRHPAFPRGANVDFVAWPERHRLEIRTFERGVEAETLACGTGILAAVAAGRAAGRLELPVEARTLGGFRLEVAAAGEGRWSLAGDARLLAEVELGDEASLPPPPPPDWSPAAPR